MNSPTRILRTSPAPGRPEAPGEGGPRFLFTSFSLGHLANDWAPGAIWIIGPSMALALGLSPSELGALFTIQAVGASLAYFPAGLLADHVRDRGRLLSLTFFWVALGFLAASFAPGFWSFAVLVAIAGLGDAAWHPIATGVLTSRWPERRGEALGIHAVGGALATVLSPLLVGYLLAVMDWRSALQISVLPALVMGVVFVLLVARRVPVASGPSLSRADVGAFFRAWWRPAGRALLGGVIAYQMAVMALMSMTPLYLQSVHGHSAAQAATVFAAALLLGALAQPLVGRLSDRVGRRRVMNAGLLGAAAGGVLVYLVPPGLASAALLVLALGVLLGIRAVVLALAVDFASRRAGTTLGFVFAVMDGVGALGALVAGLVAEWYLANAFLLAAALSLVAIAVIPGVPVEARDPEAR